MNTRSALAALHTKDKEYILSQRQEENNIFIKREDR